MERVSCLALNAHLKYIEFVLHHMDFSSGDFYTPTVKMQFKEKFKRDMPVLLNQYFGLIRLIPLMYITEHKKFDESDREKLVVIRNAFAHDDIFFDQSGYTFKANRAGNQDVLMTYYEFNIFIHRIENFSYNNS